MNSGNLESKNKIKRNQIKSKDKFEEIKSNYFLEKLFNFLDKRKSLNIIK